MDLRSELLRGPNPPVVSRRIARSVLSPVWPAPDERQLAAGNHLQGNEGLAGKRQFPVNST